MPVECNNNSSERMNSRFCRLKPHLKAEPNPDQHCTPTKQLLMTNQMARVIQVPKCSRKPVVGLSCQEFARVSGNSKEVAVCCRSEGVSNERDRMRAAGLRDRCDALAAATLCNKHDTDANDDAQRIDNRGDRVLNKAEVAQLEADEEIKALKDAIGQAKIFMIRDMQVEEKLNIKKALEQEDRRIDIIMEEERQRGINTEKEHEMKQRKLKEERKQALQNQIEANKAKTILEQVRKDKEAELINQNVTKLKLEELEEQQRCRQKKLQLSQDLDESNRLQQKRAEQECLFDKQLDLKVLQYQRQQVELEERREQEHMAARRARDQELSRRHARQQRDEGRVAAENELKIRRDFERKEREWRQRELEEAKAKTKQREQIDRARKWQISEKQRCLALEIQREQVEFLRTFENLKKSEKSRRDLEREIREKKAKELQELKQQISEVEKRRSEERKAQIEEGQRSTLVAAQKQQLLEQFKRERIQELSQSNIPSRYISRVMRMVDVDGQCASSLPPATTTVKNRNVAS